MGVGAAGGIVAAPAGGLKRVVALPTLVA